MMGKPDGALQEIYIMQQKLRFNLGIQKGNGWKSKKILHSVEDRTFPHLKQNGPCLFA